MKFLEKNLEDIIFETDNISLRKRGLFVHGNKLRQQRIGNYGIADLIVWRKTENSYCEPELDITVFELKQERVGTSTLLQASKYCRGIDRYISNHRGKDIYLNINIVLVGNSIETDSNFCYLSNYFKNLRVYTYEYHFDGIYFKQEYGWKLTDEGF